MRVVLLADWVLAGYGVPQVCARHGQPAAGVKTQFRSRTPGWAYALLALGVVPYLVAFYATRKTIFAPSWPFCAQCKALRTRNLIERAGPSMGARGRRVAGRVEPEPSVRGSGGDGASASCCAADVLHAAPVAHRRSRIEAALSG